MFPWYIPDAEPAPDKIAVEPGCEPAPVSKPKADKDALKVAVDPYADVRR